MTKTVRGPLAFLVGTLGMARTSTALLRSDAEAEVSRALASPDKAFDEWIKTHERVYSSDAERTTRHAVWLDNLAYIESHNKETESHWLGLGPFTDMTLAEFSARQTGVDEAGLAAMERNEVFLDDLSYPSSVDWVSRGAVTTPRQQGQCGSCWAFATVATIESANQIYTGQLLDLSEQELVDCDSGNHGCNGGWMTNAYGWVERNGGIDVERDYPYAARYTTNAGMCNVLHAGRKEVTIDGFRSVPMGYADQLHAAVAQQPVAVAIGTRDSRGFQHYSGGVFDGYCPQRVDHAVTAVGYGTQDGKPYWLVKNSWGTHWGDGGYIRMARSESYGYGQCSIQLYPSYPLKISGNPSGKSVTASPTGSGSLAADVCDANSYCESGECCCHDEMYGTCYTWACCLEGSTCDAKNMKCKSKGRRGPALSEAAAVLEDVLDKIKQE